MTTTSHDIVAVKAAFRADMKARRSAMPAGQRSDGAMAVAALGLGWLGTPPGTVVSGFLSFGDEINTMPLLRRLAEAGYDLCLPVMQGKAKPLLFRRWRPGDAMDTAVWGIREPKATQPELQPSVLLVPLLAYDRSGLRLGYGGGFYDRTIHGLRKAAAVTTVGLAFAEQEVDAVPHLDYDEHLDWILTPAGPIRACR
ncbi:MAG: 5-formyltetrahydrofolate cyclo-ligase [Hyphomicrobiaceae bacterium]